MSDVYQGQNAEILRATIDGTPYTEQPESYIAQLLIELKEAIEAGGGGGGGTTNYNGLSNKPQVNSVTLQGNKSLIDLGINIPTVDAALSGTSENPVQNKAVKAALDGKEDSLTFDSTPTASSTNPVTSGGVKTALNAKQDTLTFDSTPTASSNNPVTSGGIKTALDGKQDTLTIDAALSGTSENPVQNKVIKTALDNVYSKTEVDNLISAISTLSIEVVATLPTTDISTTTIYLVPNSQSQSQNVYDEYMYINNAWEHIGSTAIDLSNYYNKTQTDNLLNGKEDTLTFDSTPTASSTNPVTSGGIKTALDAKQDTLTIDAALSGTSENPVQNKVIKTALDGKEDSLTFDSTPTASSTNPVTSGGVKTAIDAVNDKLYSSIAGVAQNDKGSMELYSKNLNNIVTSGFYNAMTCTNCPFSYAALIVCGYYLTGYCFQMAVDIQTGEIQTRVQTGGTWGAWQESNNLIHA